MRARTRGLADIRTMQKAKVHSMPVKKTSKYLKLYALGMEKHRLEQFKAVIDRTQQRTDACIGDVQKEIEELAVAVVEHETGPPANQPKPTDSRMKTKRLDY